jgi:hypothetical protein
VVRAAGWHASDPGSILGRDSILWMNGYVRYTKVLISFHFSYQPADSNKQHDEEGDDNDTDDIPDDRADELSCQATFIVSRQRV